MLNIKLYRLNLVQMILTLAAIWGFFLAFNVLQAEAVSGIAGKTVVIDPGHGGDDYGCRDVKNECCEKDITLAVAMELAQLLERDGVKVKVTRNGKEDHAKLFFQKKKNGLDERIEFALKSKADLFISLHVNSYNKKDRAGAVVYYKEDSKQGCLLAQSIQKELRLIPEMPKRTSQGRNYYLLEHQQIPAAIVELGYLSNKHDMQRLLDPIYTQKVARAIYTGIINYNQTSRSAELPVNANPHRLQLKEFLGGIKGDPQEIISGTVSVLKNTICQTDAKKTEKMARYMLERLINNSGLAHSIGAAVPGAIVLNNFKLAGALAVVDLGIKPEHYISSDEEWLSVYSIASELLDLPNIDKVQFIVDGQKRKTLAGHIDIGEPISRDILAFTRGVEGVMEGKKAKVAIVVDDFGSEESKGAESIFDIGHPLTLAVMPNLPYTAQHAQRAAELGYAVIVHLPMQPVSGPSSWVGPNAISTQMSPGEVREQAQRDFSQVSYAAGFNNHMGSLATSNENTLRPLLEVTRENEFFVLDSRTTDKTKLGSMAREMGISCAERAVFLDNRRNLEHMKRQLELLSEEAIAKGSAVGIGHVGENMARAIKEMIPVMEAKGIEFVYLSELVH